MRLSRFFIDRPIFAAVIAILITIVGAIAYMFLPVSQYPEVVPPTVTVSAMYPGASAETVAETVANPIEQEINGVEGMLYQSSQSTGDGRVVITITFAQGTDLDAAQTLVQNRVGIAEPRLPEEVRRLGVVTRKTAPDFLLVVNLISPDNSLDRAYISNYAQTQIKDRLARLDGVGDVQLFGSRDLAMRVWIDPGRAAALNLTAGDIIAALRGQNVQVAAGTIGQPPAAGSAFQLNVETQGRFTDPAQFGNVVIRTDEAGRQVRVRDVARVEIGAEDYGTSAYLNDRDSVIIPVFQRPGSNALAAAEGIKAEMETLSKSFPAGLEYRIVYNPTEFIQKSIDEVIKTLIEAVALVVLVIIVFLQRWRAAVIPVLAIPVSLIGTFAVLQAVGYSLNNLSLFGLVLAIGIVVDDAIVVVENVERNLEHGMTPLEAARASMDEVGAALVAIVLVLCAVFVPTLFMGGLSGAFYQQFAVTISAATVISLVLSLTLSPAMAALLLKPHDHPSGVEQGGWRHLLVKAGDKFNHGFERFGHWYAGLTARLVAIPRRMMAIYAGLIALTGAAMWWTPTGFIPQQDQGYFLTVISLPPGSATARTDAVMKDVASRVLKIPGVSGTVMLSGFDGPSETRAASSAAAYWVLDDFAEREGKDGQDIDSLIAKARAATADIDQARLMVVKPPIIRGIGSAGGFRMMLQDRNGAGFKALEQNANELIAKANQEKGLAGVYTFFETNTPRVRAEIDRDKAEILGVPAGRVFETLSVYLGSAFVNDFNLLGRTWRVTAQADAPYRQSAADIAALQTRSDNGAMVPLGSVTTLSDTTGPYRVTRYNLAPAVAIDGDTAPGYASGQSLATIERLAAELPAGFSSEWTGIAYQQQTAGNTAAVVFGLAVVLVFLVLAAQYESLVMPLAIILIVPMCLLAAMIGINLRGMDNNVLTQIGLVVLIALAAKNAILIVEFARQAEAEGLSTVDAAVRAAQDRLRPILMTSFAFILGAVPLVTASGAGAELRQALGTAVCFGMLGVTGFGLLFTPTFYVVCRALGDRIDRMRGRNSATPPALQPAE